MFRNIALIAGIAISSGSADVSDKLNQEAEAHGKRAAALCEGVEFESSELAPNQEIGRAVVYFRNIYHARSVSLNDCLADPEKNLENRRADGSKNCFTTRAEGKPVIEEKLHRSGGLEQTVLVGCH